VKIETLMAVVDEQRREILRLHVDHAIDAAYRDGRLLHKRDERGNILPSPNEARLRRLAEREGFAELEAELASMPQLAPIGKRAYDPFLRSTHEEGEISAELASVAAQLNLDPNQLAAEYEKYLSERR